MKQKTFQKKLEYTFGFIKVADYTDTIKETLFRVFVRHQYGAVDSKVLFIAPKEAIVADEEMVYNEKVPNFYISHGELFGKKLDIETINKLVKDDYSVFIYDLKKCIEEEILTEEDYSKFVDCALHHYYDIQKPFNPRHPYDSVFGGAFIRYVIDLTGLETDYKFNLHEQRAEVIRWLERDKRRAMVEMFHEFCFYEDSPQDCEEFRYALENYDYEIVRKSNSHMGIWVALLVIIVVMGTKYLGMW